MKRALTLVSGVSASLYPIVSCALGLGDLQVDSRLNQPLRAHIEISDVSEEEWRQIHARLAEQGEGGALVRTVLDSIVFRATEDASHRHFVEVSSRDPITEPLFDLSVEVAGETVQVIRSYSVFLDPPGRDEVGSRGVWVAGSTGTRGESPGAAGAVSGAIASSSAPATASAADRGVAGAAVSAARANTRSAARSGAARRSAAGGGVAADGSAGAASTAAGAGANQQLQAGAVYTVVPSDTLERIVRRLGARTAAAKNQQMQWVFEHNPAAFYGNMDRLRAGARLTLPQQGAAAMAASTQGAAPAETGGTAQAAVPAATAGGADREPARSAAAAADQKVAAPDDRALQTQLESQVGTLQQSLAKMQETIAAQDAEIADLNRKIAARADQQRAERATDALAARIAPEVASAAADPSSSDDTTVATQPPRWWAKRATYYWGGALGAVAVLVAVLVTVVRRRRAAEEQYAPRYPLVEDSPFRYRATLESPPLKQATPQPEPEVRKPSSGMHVEEQPGESGLESWSTQTALLLSELPAADDTQPFMMAPHDDVEAEYESKRKSYTANTEEPTAKLQAMESNTVELQTTGELMSPEELEEAELLGLGGPVHGPEDRTPAGSGQGAQDEGRWPPSASGRSGQDESRRPPSGPEQSWHRDSRAGSSGSGERDRTSGGPRQFGQGDSRPAANEPGPFGQGDERAGPSRGAPAKGGTNQGTNRAVTPASSPAGDDARTMEIGSDELLAAQALAMPTNPEAMRTVEMDLAQLRATESRHDRAAVNKELAEVLEASLNYEPDRVDIQLKLLEIYHHEALGNRDNFRSLLSKLTKDSRLLSPAQRERVEALQRTLNDGKPDTDSTFVAEVAI